MRKALPLLTLIGLLLGPSAQAADVRVAVFSLGADPVAAGGLQLTLEDRLRAADGVDVVSVNAIATLFAIKEVVRPADPDRPRRARLLEAGSLAYYEGEYDAAAKQLTALGALMDEPAVPIDERVRFHLWEASVAVARNQNEVAERAVLEALVMRPNLAVDLETFRPSLATLVDVMRDAGLDNVQTTVAVEPESATLFIDEKPARPGTLTLAAGTHWVTASAPGFRTVSRALEVKSGSRTTITLPIALQANANRILGGLLGGRRLTEKQITDLEDIAAQLDVDALVVTSSRRNPDLQQKGVIWFWGDERLLISPVFTRANRGPLGLIAWVNEGLQGDTGKNGGGGGGGGIQSGAPSPITFDISVAEGLFAVRRYFLQSPEGGGTDVTFPGFGPRVRAVIGWRFLYTELSGQYITYTVLKPTIQFPDGSTRVIDGGASSTVRGAFGVEFWFGDRFAAGAFGAYLYEDHQEGSDVELFPGYFRSAAELGATGAIQLGPVIVRGRGGVTPYSTWQEVPRGTTGQSPRTTLGYGWGASVEWAPNDRWNLVGGYEGEIRGVQFDGTSAIVFDPAIEDALLQEVTNTGLFSLRILF